MPVELHSLASKLVAGGNVQVLRHKEILNQFHQALGRLVHAHAQFDFNVGISLNALGIDTGYGVAKVLVGKAPSEMRLKNAKKLLLVQYAGAPEQAKKELREWFKSAHDLRALRNKYAHARWHVPLRSESEDPLFRMLPLNWDFDPNQKDKSVPIRLSELHANAAKIEELSGGLGTWMRKNAQHAKRRSAK